MLEIPTALRWLYLDLNSYFASVEQQLQPPLRGRPVAVVPTSGTDSTCAIAASYEAKAFGVKTGTMIYDARRMCPGLLIVPARHDKYVDFHHQIMAEIERHIPLTKICSIDEVACRLIGPDQNKENAIALAAQIKQGIARNVGLYLRSSIGIAPNKFLAKVASNLKKPDGLTVLEGHELPDRLRHLSLRDLPGIGQKIEQRLAKAGITSLQNLWMMAPKHARSVWHSVQGERFWYALHGIEVSEPTTSKRHTIGHSQVLAPAMRPQHQAHLIARRLTVKAVTRMRRLGFYANFYQLSLHYEGHDRPESGGWQKSGGWQGCLKLPIAQDNFTFLTALNQLWANQSNGPSNRQSNGQSNRQSNGQSNEGNLMRVKQVSVALYGLIHQNDRMPDMFEALGDPLERQQKKHDRLSSALDIINKKYGLDTITIGVLPTPLSPNTPSYTGSKIAFTRIPEQAEFFE